MDPPSADALGYVIELDDAQARLLLGRAAAAGEEVSVLPNTRVDGLPLTAPISRTTEQGIVLRSDAPNSADPSRMVSAYCEASGSVDGVRFLFPTSVIEATVGDGYLEVEIAKPKTVRVAQRRKWQRRDLRAKTHVRMVSTDDDGLAVEASLLNISTGGLACRVGQSDARRLGGDCAVDLEFTVAGCDETFHMAGRVCGQTPGGTPGCAILSVKFASGPDNEGQRERLGVALYRGLAAVTGG